MTDVSLPKAHADPQLPPVSAIAPLPVAHAPGIRQLDGTADEEEEEFSEIKCICRFKDDDGNTVFCELCWTWQHISCYYWPDANVPDVHECVDCHPRHIDSSAARIRQEQSRDGYTTGDPKAKQPAQRRHSQSQKRPHDSMFSDLARHTKQHQSWNQARACTLCNRSCQSIDALVTHVSDPSGCGRKSELLDELLVGLPFEELISLYANFIAEKSSAPRSGDKISDSMAREFATTALEIHMRKQLKKNGFQDDQIEMMMDRRKASGFRVKRL